MKCPECNSIPVILELLDTEVDYCFNCHGIWLDYNELSILLREKPEYCEVNKKSRYHCPVCGMKMKQIYINKFLEPVIDMCPVHHGFWLENGELLRAIENTSEAEGNPVKKVLTEIFNK